MTYISPQENLIIYFKWWNINAASAGNYMFKITMETLEQGVKYVQS